MPCPLAVFSRACTSPCKYDYDKIKGSFRWELLLKYFQYITVEKVEIKQSYK